MRLAMSATEVLHHAQPSVTTTTLQSAKAAIVVDVIEVHPQMGVWTLGKSPWCKVMSVTWLTLTIVDRPLIVVRTSANRTLATQAPTCLSLAYILVSQSLKSLVFSRSTATSKVVLS